MIVKYYCEHCRQSFKTDKDCLKHETTCRQAHVNKGQSIAQKLTGLFTEADNENIKTAIRGVSYDVEQDELILIARNSNY